uniref:interferon-induced very large GTPase 1-like n=1 Tax=Maylandia zebra TaxID=106582 RepID=UPI000D321384|nr:interferon-induced very large GTPase 1-like [Maylandia zebra]
MDVQMAVFHCSDSFLKQMMITKLSQCQYALPLLVPDPVTMEIECPLWTFKQITKTWKVTEIKDGSNIVTMKSVPVCKAKTPLVSFYRLGSLSVSKSQLMNTLINDRHNTFFHRNCPGSTKSRYLMDGVAEIAWYCPAGKPNDAFNDCIAFCNLHGDALSIEKQHDLSAILKSYNEKWSEVLALKNKSDKSEMSDSTNIQKKSDLLIKKQTELEEISRKLQSATFGLEHIFREMGQIYEAHRAIERESRQTHWSKYPELAAQLMISGHPMELMDGDAGHVPLTWISSLLEEVIKKLGDQRVFVLSVLGVQSSGKSTMLNTMFGLQFAVSAGRCTKGAFMQLLKVSEEMKKEKDLKFDYLLVVDTEGLRALELEGNTTRHHDNELATFVVGLGNLTLINIFGENPSEMQDILQIVVQAFMRMKKVKLSPSCVFVHQNVTDVAAAEKNMEGKRRLLEKLDEMTKLAAEEEDCDADCFSDVIEFDVQKDVKYCTQLWEGSPPMAPPNPGYSESIQEVKNTILSKASKSAGITLTQFKTNIRDLWSALLNENFVFSFKNTLEIAAYRKLESQYANWTWALRSNMLTIENQLHNRIENGSLEKVELSYLKKESKKTYETIENKMTTYFEEDNGKEMLAQWRGRFETKIREFHDEQVSMVKRKLDEVIQHKKARKKLDDKKKEFEDKLLQRSKELAQQLKDKADDEEELKKQFNCVWTDLVTEITADIKPVEDINLEKDQFIIIKELISEEDIIHECKKNDRYKKIAGVGDYSDYVKPPKIICRHETTVCTNTIEGHSPDDHSVPFHRPSGIKGWHYRGTVEFSVNFCTTNIASDGSFYPRPDSEETVPFKEYKKAGGDYAKWKITPDESKMAYWKWFVCRFQSKLEEHYELKFQNLGEIPSEWKTTLKHEAIKSLNEMC